jgi:hypothetical protein
MLDDYMRENSIECSIGRFLSGLSNTIDGLSESFGDVDIKEMLKQYVK